MSPGAPLLLTEDEALTGEVLRLAAAAGTPVEVLPGLTAGLGPWANAEVVLVGADQAARLVGAAPPPRDQVHVLALGSAPDPLFRSALDLRASSVLELPAAEQWLVEMLTDLGDGAHRPATTVAVVGGSGGVGATVLAAALALTAGRDARVMLVDLDPWGPGLRRIVGLDEPTGVTWRDLAQSPGRLGSRALRDALPGRDGVGVLGWPDETTAVPSPALVREVLSAGSRGHDWLVIDSPRGADPAMAAMLGRCHHVVLVARAAVGAVASAARVADRLRSDGAAVGAVVRCRRGSPLAEDVARALGLELLCELPDQRRLDEHLDLGLGPVRSRRCPLALSAAALVDRLGVGR
ncbi:MAG: Septum site-determining protein MinD [uncultured Nocardioidaceae bacterium]|uniref:Septum site-determining protein MinD n=1 Tax=uncultured Nocardioidaceae bacterium TaxID=253824 RepID=A0A6J4MQE3_9ACTN|nr:MAG: Septum site-determining protein MinD [uncultured Nocardioidaceae bacterium]